MTNYSRSVLKSNGLRHPKNLPVKFGFSPKTVSANAAQKLPPQCCSKPLFIAFFSLSHKWPTFAFAAKAGTHSAFGERSHTRAYTTKHRPSLPRPQHGLELLVKSPPKEQPEKTDARQWRVSAFSGDAAPPGCVICLQLGDVAVFSLCAQYFLNVRGGGGITTLGAFHTVRKPCVAGV